MIISSHLARQEYENIIQEKQAIIDAQTKVREDLREVNLLLQKKIDLLLEDLDE